MGLSSANDHRLSATQEPGRMASKRYQGTEIQEKAPRYNAYDDVLEGNRDGPGLLP